MAWSLGLGWKTKAERLRVTILSAGHQLARELPPGLTKVLAMFRHAAETGDGAALREPLPDPDPNPPIWEPVEVHGWKIQATMYLLNGQLWWLAYAQRRNQSTPADNDIAFLEKIVAHLGADPKLDLIIGPASSPPGEPPLPFGWWTWFNRSDLLEIQINKAKKNKDAIRIVPLGAAESDGYVRLDNAAP
jgi:hypothetical protein